MSLEVIERNRLFFVVFLFSQKKTLTHLLAYSESQKWLLVRICSLVRNNISVIWRNAIFYVKRKYLKVKMSSYIFSYSFLMTTKQQIYPEIDLPKITTLISVYVEIHRYYLPSTWKSVPIPTKFGIVQPTSA